MLDDDKRPKFIAPIIDRVEINETKTVVNPVIKISNIVTFKTKNDSTYMSFSNGGEYVKYHSIEFTIVRGDKAYTLYWFLLTPQERDREYSRLLNILT